MRALYMAAGAVLALSACGRADEAAVDNELDAMTADNGMIGDNGMMADPALNGAGGMDGNLATDADTENMMMNDLQQNDADTNLANGI